MRAPWLGLCTVARFFFELAGDKYVKESSQTAAESETRRETLETRARVITAIDDGEDADPLTLASSAAVALASPREDGDDEDALTAVSDADDDPTRAVVLRERLKLSADMDGNDGGREAVRVCAAGAPRGAARSARASDPQSAARAALATAAAAR